MTLAQAQVHSGAAPPLPSSGPPYPCASLKAWAGRTFDLPAGDPRLVSVHAGGMCQSAPLDNLVGAVRYWQDHPDWMEFLDPSSPSHHDKMVERALYLDFWQDWVASGARVLDLGGGVGRFTDWLLRRGCAVELVDPDLRSLWRAVQTAANLGRGAIDVHWSTGERLPDLCAVDVALLAEVLCYVENPGAVLDRVHQTLRPDGVLLCSVEARWGWSMAADVAEGTVGALLSDGVVHVPGDRWVRTFTGESFRDLLECGGFEVISMQRSHYAFSGPFEACSGPMDAARALELEASFRAHPVLHPLNRAWMAVARRSAK